MIAQLLLTALLTLVLVYAWSAHRTVPIIGLLASGAALAGLYFVWVQEHATALAALVGIGRGSDLIVYIWVVSACSSCSTCISSCGSSST